MQHKQYTKDEELRRNMVLRLILLRRQGYQLGSCQKPKLANVKELLEKRR